ncbi:hypothetical protein N8865_02640 [Francisellaceae bacterium]|nr:hypothetical protein [Francisellaceae bacterium]
MNKEQRNKSAKDFITKKLDLVSPLSESYFEDIKEYIKLKEILGRLIEVNTKGFRGIVATAITGRFLNPKYDPLNNFYSCNPRSIFEQGIFYAFENRIPCGKSDPLNVAKNINVLDYEWAKGKRPQTAANAVIEYLKYIENEVGVEYEKAINYFFYRLLKYSNNLASIKIEMPLQGTISNQNLSHKLLRFSLEYPESGTVPQFVISKLIYSLYDKSSIKVIGGDESVFGTNTTSKKPSDIWLECSNKVYNLFEITVKKIDFKRLDDCIQSLHSVGELGTQITFICRIPDDILSLDNVKNNSFSYKGKIFDFVDIKSFIPSITALLSKEESENLLRQLKLFIVDINRPKKTKDGWNNIFGS